MGVQTLWYIPIFQFVEVLEMKRRTMKKTTTFNIAQIEIFHKTQQRLSLMCGCWLLLPAFALPGQSPGPLLPSPSWRYWWAPVDWRGPWSGCPPSHWWPASFVPPRSSGPESSTPHPGWGTHAGDQTPAWSASPLSLIGPERGEKTGQQALKGRSWNWGVIPFKYLKPNHWGVLKMFTHFTYFDRPLHITCLVAYSHIMQYNRW